MFLISLLIFSLFTESWYFIASVLPTFLKTTYAVTSEQGIKQDLCSYYSKLLRRKVYKSMITTNDMFIICLLFLFKVKRLSPPKCLSQYVRNGI